jgi:hypothetical protein
MLAWPFLAFANIKPPFFNKNFGLTTLPSSRIKSSLPYISVSLTTLAPAGKVVTLLYY